MRRRALFLDRDGVINEERGYVGSWDQFAFMPDVFDILVKAQDAGYRLVITTNQSGVARGYYNIADYEDLTRRMLDSFAAHGISIDMVLAGFCHELGVVPELARQSQWRKPNVGMAFEAATKLGLDLSRSAMIGDKDTDMQFAKNAGIPTRLWLTHGPYDPVLGVGVPSLAAAWEAMKAMA